MTATERRILQAARWLALAAALAFLASRWDTPIHGDHLYRQAQTVSNIERMIDGGLLQAPGTFNLGVPNCMYDFPLYQGIVATIAQTLGIDPVLTCRVLGLLIFAAGFPILAAILRTSERSRRVREWTLLFYTLAPMHVFYSSAPSPDPLACLLAMLAVLAFERALRQDTNRTAWLPLLFVSAFASTLIKIPVFLPAATVIGLRAFASHGSRALLRPELLVAAAASALAVATFLIVEGTVNAAWHRDHVFGAPPRAATLYWYFSNLTDRTTWSHYATILKYLGKHLLNPLTLTACGVGIVLALRRRRVAEVMPPWLLGSVAAISIFFNLQWRHNFYLLPYVVPFSYFAAVGVAWTLERTRGTMQRAACCGWLAAAGFFSIKYVARLDSAKAEEVQRLTAAGAMLRDTTARADLIVYLVATDDSQPQHLYFARREGVTVEPAELDRRLWGRIQSWRGTRGRVLVFCPASLAPRFAPRAEQLGLRHLATEQPGSLFAGG